MKQSNWIKRSIAAACCAGGIATASATTVTLTFDQFDDPYFPNSYTQSGYIITSLYPGEGHLHAGNGYLELHNHGGSSPYQIQRTDGGSFDLLRLDYSGGESVFISDTGATFTILGDQPRATFSMPSAFENVSYILWYMNGAPEDWQEQWGQIDNVVLNTAQVPEPAQAVMLGLGLAGLLLGARRSHRPKST